MCTGPCACFETLYDSERNTRSSSIKIRSWMAGDNIKMLPIIKAVSRSFGRAGEVSGGVQAHTEKCAGVPEMLFMPTLASTDGKMITCKNKKHARRKIKYFHVCEPPELVSSLQRKVAVEL